MKKVLYMHSGSGNHGCEAIVRTTAKLLGGPQDVVVWSWNVPEDQKYGLSPQVEKLVATEEMERFTPAYFEAQLKRRLLGSKGAFRQVFLKTLFKDAVAVSVGGDNYCYEHSAREGAQLDREIRRHCACSVFWGCSVEEEAITPEIREDFAGFDLITARESISYSCLKKINPNTILVSDPAFLLDTVELPLPKEFAQGNTVGINVSPMVVAYSGGGSIVPDNYEALIRYILERTDMNVCLIPHVVWAGTNDLEPLSALYEKFRDSGRVCLIGDHNAMELKGYIARCRFFVGARTHATIAAYSSCVPTLVTGYSVKARGIARDLFGTEEHYVLPVQSLREKNELTDAFCWLMENEERVRRQLCSIMPEYKNRARAAGDAFRRLLQGSDAGQDAHGPVPAADCTGCGACAAACPQGCIEMRPDAEGFRQPVTDNTRCVRCRLCERVCPVRSRPALNRTPDGLAARHTDAGIRADSSSGGVFTALAEQVMARGGVVCAAKYDGDFSVVHDFARRPGELDRFRGAKYAQSRVEHCFPEIDALLRAGTPVLFAGTPCQTAGLAAYLGKPREGLILADMICHGVPSPKVWQSYLQERKELDAPESALKSINLRSKQSGWSRYSYSVEMTYQDGSRYLVPQGEDRYMRGFTENLYLRPSCERCGFKGLQRCSDVTLGDFWGIWDQHPEMDDNRGTSLLWLHSGKGRALWQAVAEQFESLPVSPEESVRCNSSAVAASVPHPKRQAFFDAMGKGSTIALIEKMLEPEVQKPTVFRRILKRVKQGIR